MENNRLQKRKQLNQNFKLQATKKKYMSLMLLNIKHIYAIKLDNY